MLSIPQRKIGRSVTKHNSALSVFCDWLELSTLLHDEELSHTDVLDVLIEQQIYDSDASDFCMEFITSGWREIRRRHKCLGRSSPFRIYERRIAAKADWKKCPAYVFCLVLSIAPYIDSWADEFGSDYNDQGELFERLFVESGKTLFGDWEFKRTGWSRKKATKLAAVVSLLADSVDEEIGDVSKYASKSANEAGLDVFWHRRFPDSRGGYPVYIAQCASGANWHTKLDTPAISVWNKLVDWKFPPCRAFATPFALEDNDFTVRCNQFNGLFFDRYRLMAPTQRRKSWVSDELSADLIAWLDSRVVWLLKLL